MTIDDVPPDPISGLAASNDSPTQVDGVTGLSATISAGDNVSYEWDFGDGTPPGSGANVSHSYGAVGNYTAIVTASNSVSSESATTVVTITDVPPLASFTSSSPDELGQETTFSNTSSGTNLSYLWDFGDGNGSTIEHPSHTYGQIGTYTVMLTVSNSAGSNSTSAQVTITDVPPLASFTSSSPDELGQETTFSNTSTGTNLSYLWDFGDGNGSTEPNPTHTYNQIGTYSVMLTVSNSAGSNSTSAQVTITDVPPLASFTSSSPDQIGQETTFNNTSSGSNLSYLWDFGDGNSSTEPNPTHTYGQTGNYTVVLTVSNSAGANSTSVRVRIRRNVK